VKNLIAKLASALRKALGQDVDLIQGPFVQPALGGLRQIVFVAVSSFQDEGGIVDEGARTSRFPVSGKSGYVEERPGRLNVRVDCIGLSYPSVVETCESIIPAALVALDAVASVPFGSTTKPDLSLVFTDFTVSLHSLSFGMEPDKDRPYSRATLMFELEGFIRAEFPGRKVRQLPTAKRKTKKRGDMLTVGSTRNAKRRPR